MYPYSHRDPQRDRPALDNRAFSAVLCAILICTILVLAESIGSDAPARPPALAAAASQPQCPCL